MGTENLLYIVALLFTDGDKICYGRWQPRSLWMKFFSSQMLLTLWWVYAVSLVAKYLAASYGICQHRSRILMLWIKKK